VSAKVSVIIPTFNRAQLVPQAVESVLGQRGDFAFEIIVVDDGSSATTGSALRRFGDSIRYVRQENAGLNPARNHGLRLATGDYIALLDDDDVWLPFKTRLLVAALQRFPSAGFVHSNFHIWDSGRDRRRPDGLRTWFPRPFAWSEIYDERIELQVAADDVVDADAAVVDAYAGDLYAWSIYAPMVLPSTAIVRRSVLGQDTFPEVDSVGDWEFFARLSHRSQAVFVPVGTTLNRSHEDAVRLTRVDPRLQLRDRIGLIHRLWHADPDFMRTRRRDLDAVEADCLRQLARHCIAAGDGAAARGALSELAVLPQQRSAKDALLWGLARLPYSSRVVAAMRKVRARWRPAARIP
jgi:glycosyltransferase involved in cell wall biosynthesis